MSKLKDLTGRKFGRLTVIKRVSKPKHIKKKLNNYWLCNCDCGKECIVYNYNLRKGLTKSCGCLKVGHRVHCAIDLTGKRFGKWLVLSRALRPDSQNNGTWWKCKCDCGTIRSVRSATLRKGQSKSCGCGRTDYMIGQRFGMLTVIRRVPKPIHIKKIVNYYLCKCDCGNEKIISRSNLKTGHTKSCGKHRFNDLTGQRFGRLIVIKKANNSRGTKGCPSGRVRWLCKCDCGKEKIVWGDSLKTGSIKSCGCLNMEVRKRRGKERRNFIDLTGQRFGKLTVISLALKPANLKGNQRYWKCKCDCGKETIVLGASLKRGTKSCGCLVKEVHLLQYSEASLNSLFGVYIKSADNRKLSFELTKDEFRLITKKSCHYCGSEPTNMHGANNCNGKYNYSGLDRVDSSKGYTIDNVVPCCKICNRAKSDMAQKKFLAWIERVHNHQSLKNNNLKRKSA
ncbi:MAG: hypothetical protein KAU06_04730 [Candidatus Marinimicrobia bacterium]|nr:hypothetical protein [Candidatus Neomarinimicrobiota bacterium]